MTNIATDKIQEFFNKPFFKKKSTLFCLWALIGLIAGITKLHRCNNFLIFKYVFHHTIHQTSLYAEYPSEYSDTNHYGPLFSLVIAPFAVLPDWMGVILWCFVLAVFLYWAVSYLPKPTYIFVVWFCAHELLTALFMQQFNVAIAALIVMSFVFVEKEKDWWATLFIIIGTFVKLYGVVGLAFFFFSKHKKKFIVSLIGWGVVCFLLPMLISSPEYQVSQWQEWYQSLEGKNMLNLVNGGQNISLLGMIRKIGYSYTIGHEAFMPVIHGDADVDTNNWWWYGFKDIWIIVPSMVLFAIGYFQIDKWKDSQFRYKVLAGILMIVVLFSTGSESSGYIIALVGCSIWYCTSTPKSVLESRVNIGLMVFAFILTSLSPSDLFPHYLKYYWVQPYALKALPVTLIWLKLCYELIFYKTEHSLNKDVING